MHHERPVEVLIESSLVRREHLSPGLLVAAVDDDGHIERAEVREVGGWKLGLAARYEDTGKDHLVVFQTGVCKNSDRVRSSRQIVSTWTEYEPQWKEQRNATLRRESRLAMRAHNREEAVKELEQIQAVLETLEIKSGLGSIIEKTDGTMRYSPAIFLNRENAALLFPHLKAASLEVLLKS